MIRTGRCSLCPDEGSGRDGVVEDDGRERQRRDGVDACDVGGLRVLHLGRDKAGDAGLSCTVLTDAY